MARAKQNASLLKRLQKRFPKVTRVVDATEEIRVSVKEMDCKGGIGGSFDECALARATKRSFKADACHIGLGFSYVIRGRVATRYQTPESVSREMVSFDRHHDFDLGEYHLRPPAKTQRLGAWRKWSSGKATGTGQKQKRHTHYSGRVRRVRQPA